MENFWRKLYREPFEIFHAHINAISVIFFVAS